MKCFTVSQIPKTLSCARLAHEADRVLRALFFAMSSLPSQFFTLHMVSPSGLLACTSWAMKPT